MGIASERISVVPLHHLDIEAAAFPLWSEAAFSINPQILCPSLSDPLTRVLWQRAEAYFIKRTPALSLDELQNIRDFWWFDGSSAAPVSMVDYLYRLANTLLRRQGSGAVPRLYCKNDNTCLDAEARWVWRWVCFALPPDLLLAALGTDGESMPSRVEACSETLGRELLDNGFAEPHLHINAGLDFRFAWASLMHNLALPGQCAPSLFQSEGAAFDNGVRLGAWLVRGAITRLIAARFLFDTDRTTGDFEAYLTHRVLRQAAHKIGYSAAVSVIPSVLSSLRTGRLEAAPCSYSILQCILRDLSAVQRKPPVDLEQVFALDPLASVIPNTSNRITPEMRFIKAGMQYLKESPTDEGFAALFWQLVRLRAILYRHIVQRPMTPGLRWFVRFYNRLRPARLPDMRLRVMSAARMDGLGRGLRSFEIRTVPEDRPDQTHRSTVEIIEGFRELQEAERGRSLPECGIVYHFPRSRQPRSNGETHCAFWQRTHLDPSGQQFRYADYYRQQRRSAVSLGRTVLRDPGMVLAVRGIDICTDEIGVPTWVFCPIFKYLTECFRLAAPAVETAVESGLHLRKTVHAGEDFIHLMSGLRKIHEAFRYLGFEENDRIGHGMALGVLPRLWAERTGRLRMAVEDRLFDLIWEYGVYIRQEAECPQGRRIFLEQQIRELARRMFAPALSGDASFHPGVLYEFVEALHEPDNLGAVGFPNRRVPRTRGPEDLLTAYLTDSAVFRSGRNLIFVETQDEIPILEGLQTAVRRQLAAQGIVVEVNPSSNLLIGHLGDMRDHPLWRIMPVENSSDASLAVCIGTDDPLTFATDMYSEYQLVWDTLGRLGYSDSARKAWLDNARRTGLLSRFTLPVNFNDARAPSVPTGPCANEPLLL